MKKKIFKTIFQIVVFSGGVVLGKQIQKRYYKKKTLYAGTLQVMMNKDSAPELFLALDISPEEVIKLTNVILDVKRFDIPGLA